MLNQLLNYEKTYLLAFGLITSCQSPDEISETSSNFENYNARTTTSSLVTLEEAKSIALRQRPIGSDPLQPDPCSGVQFPIFTPQQVEKVITILDKNSNPTMCLFNADTSRFLLLSASKLEEPILAFSTEASFEMEDMPRDLAIWLDLGITKISQFNKMNYYYDLSVYDSWNALGINSPASDYFIGDRNGIPVFIDWPTFTRENVGCPYIKEETKTEPLLDNIMWGQGLGYNESQDFYNDSNYTEYAEGKCSSMPSNNKFLAGCTFVAFGQIMKYHNDFGDVNLQGNDVVENVSVYTTSQTAGVSLLMKGLYDLTQGTTRNCSKGTGAHIYKVADVLRSNTLPYKYSSAHYVSNMNTLLMWENIVENSLPVVLCGYSVKPENSTTINIKVLINNREQVFGTKIEGGHAWVCDGYLEQYQKVKVTNNTTNEVSFQEEFKQEFWHMNWGWHKAGQTFASNNGWYRDGLFKPHGQDNGTDLIDFNDLRGYDVNGDGVNESSYHQGYYYNRSMVINIKP
ncbi:hypothetical protein EG240_11030 [Paenimyroides tangerinum]|uniref:Spi protease inhibitor domain-containing protein n=1 Tax=Paenimyroides tangerinum TaxID=2488728 RepID=A0A3P3W3V1_9FLAO|nr:C10 family peptidase [Paenimyroides tangerinum]RRJ89640.1 hypothetical protein EG240_11030 [Paenimyroides tangerinum]